MILRHRTTMQEILQRCRWDFVIRSFKAVRSNHDRELTMERFQKRRYVLLSNLTDSKKWVCSGQQSNSFKNTQNIKSIVKIHKYSKIHRKEQDMSLSKTKHDQVLFWTIRQTDLTFFSILVIIKIIQKYKHKPQHIHIQTYIYYFCGYVENERGTEYAANPAGL